MTTSAVHRWAIYAAFVVSLLTPLAADGCKGGNTNTGQQGGSGQTCKASYYGGGEKLNKHTANGEVFDPRKMTAAHRSWKFNTRVQVTNTANGKSVTVRINDRGPAGWTGRCIDLTRSAFAKIGDTRKGELTVKIRRL